MQPTTVQSEYYKEIFKVEIFQGRKINSEKNPSSRSDLDLYCSCFSFSYFVFACTFFTLHFVKHKEKHLKCERIWKVLSYFYFLRSG